MSAYFFSPIIFEMLWNVHRMLSSWKSRPDLKLQKKTPSKEIWIHLYDASWVECKHKRDNKRVKWQTTGDTTLIHTDCVNKNYTIAYYRYEENISSLS